MKLTCNTCGAQTEEHEELVFDDMFIITNCKEPKFEELAQLLGPAFFELPTDRHQDTLPKITLERFEVFLKDHTDFITVHTSAHWDKLGEWEG